MELEGGMRIPGPYSDDTWDWLPRSNGLDARAEPKATNRPAHVLWELGLVLLVPLAGVGIVDLVLNALHVY
jgi:hypothetical protein